MAFLELCLQWMGKVSDLSKVSWMIRLPGSAIESKICFGVGRQVRPGGVNISLKNRNYSQMLMKTFPQQEHICIKEIKPKVLRYWALAR